MLRPLHCTCYTACTRRTLRVHALSTLQRQQAQHRQTLGTHCTCWMCRTCCTHRHCRCCTPARTVCTTLHGVLHALQVPSLHALCALHTKAPYALCRHCTHAACTASPQILCTDSCCAYTLCTPCTHCTRCTPCTDTELCTLHTHCTLTAHIRCALHAAGADIALCMLHAWHTDAAPWPLRTAPALHTLHMVGMQHKLPCTRAPTLRTCFTHSTPHSVHCRRALPLPAVRTPVHTPGTLGTCPRRQASHCTHPRTRTGTRLLQTRCARPRCPLRAQALTARAMHRHLTHPQAEQHPTPTPLHAALSGQPFIPSRN